MTKSLSEEADNVIYTAFQSHPHYHQGFNDAQRGEPLFQDASALYAMGWNGYWKAREILGDVNADTRAFYNRPAEDLTPEGVQLVLPGAERRLPPTVKQGELW